MANGTDTEEYVSLTKPKKGLKRELEFALKSQSQITGLTRRTKRGSGQDTGSGNALLSELSVKRLKTDVKEAEVVKEGVVAEVVKEGVKEGVQEGMVAEEENGVRSPGSEESGKSGVLDPASDDERKSDSFSSNGSVKDEMMEIPGGGGAVEEVEEGKKVEGKPLQHYVRTKLKGKVAETADGDPLSHENPNSEAGTGFEKVGRSMTKLSHVPKNLRDFLETGVFEGLPVKYHRSMKAKVAGEDAELSGVIKGSGILCFCDKCKGEEVVSPNVFELHAGSTNKRPPEYIFLENRKSLRNVMNACKGVPMDAIEDTIRKATAPLLQAAVDGPICDSHAKRSPVTPCSRNSTESSVTRSADKAASSKPLTTVLSGVGSVLKRRPEGKITKKDLGLHRMVFEGDFLPDGTEVGYFGGGKRLRSGYKSGTGICCDCCSKVISPSQFEVHAGRASHRKPFHNIYISNGMSLHEVAVSLVKHNKTFVKENDKLCKKCGEGGDLIWCRGCPRSFHKECAHSLNKLDGIWYCRTCENNAKEKFNNANAIAAGRVPGVDTFEQIVNRNIRIVNKGEVETGGCIVCRDPAFDKVFGPRTVIICEQCEREYHVGCLKDKGMADLKKEPEGDWFCCYDCERIHSSLHKLVARGYECLPDSLLGAIKSKIKPSGDSASGSSFTVKWRIISGKMASEESRPLLLTAVDLLRENFGHIIDPGTDIDLIPAMVNAEELKIHDFRGMYCAVLTVNSAVVSVGVFRVRGEELAELPLVATSSQAHGKGYFQTLFACLERFFGFLKVQKTVLPAADGAEAIWTMKFGFSQMSEEELKPFMETYHLMNFQGLPWFKKAVTKVRIIS